MSIILKVQRIHSDSVLPSYAKPGDAGMDLYSYENCILKPGERRAIGTGVKFEIPRGYEVQLRPRSGLAFNNGITILNTPGTIDSGYRGEIKAILINHGDKNYEIKKGDKIAQGVLKRLEEVVIEEVSELSASERGEGGFGHTGR